MSDKSETPRTEAALATLEYTNVQHLKYSSAHIVLDLCRELERALAAATGENARLRGALEKTRDKIMAGGGPEFSGSSYFGGVLRQIDAALQQGDRGAEK